MDLCYLIRAAGKLIYSQRCFTDQVSRLSVLDFVLARCLMDWTSSLTLSSSLQPFWNLRQQYTVVIPQPLVDFVALSSVLLS